MSSKSKVGEIFYEVVHNDNFVFQQMFELPVHYFKRLSTDPSVILYPLVTIQIVNYF